VTELALVVAPATALVSAGEAALRRDAPLAIGLTALTALTVAMVLSSHGQSTHRVAGVERAVRAHRLVGVVAVLLTGAQCAVAPGPAEAVPLVAIVLPPLARPATTTAIGVLLLIAVAVAKVRLPAQRPVWRALHVVLAVVLFGATVAHVAPLAWASGGVLAPISVLAAAATAGVVLVRRWIVPRALSRVAFAVQCIRTESNQLATLVLQPLRRRTRLSFRPGQFAWLHLDDRDGPRLWEPFTISSGSTHDQLEFAVEPSHDKLSRLLLRPGRAVYLDGPHDPWHDGHQGSLLLVADHNGVGSLLGILRAQASRRDGRPHCLVIGARTVDDLTNRRELEELSRTLDLDVVEVLSEPGASWTGRRGRLDSGLLLDILEQRPALTAPHAYVCGATELLNETRSALDRLGLPAGRIHVNRPDASRLTTVRH
jgi:predicted ferric reductase